MYHAAADLHLITLKILKKMYRISWPIRHTVIFLLEIFDKIMMNVF